MQLSLTARDARGANRPIGYTAATVPAPPQRIASLLASGTELVCALGLGDRLVGRSHECDHPAWVTRLPVLSQPAFDVTGSSGDIDARVRQRLRSGEPLYRVDETRLAELAPDVILTQTHCEVCAVSTSDLIHAVRRIDRVREHELRSCELIAGGAGPSQGPASIEGILTGFERVAEVLGAAETGRALVAAIRARLAALAARTAPLPHPGVVCLEWLDPPFAMGNWGPELVAVAGGRSLLGEALQRSTTTTWQAVVDADPDVLVIAPCGFAIDRTLAEMPALAARPGWSALRAVRGGRVFVADGNLYFNRSGPALFDTPEILAEIFHPERFSPPRFADRWRRFP